MWRFLAVVVVHVACLTSTQQVVAMVAESTTLTKTKPSSSASWIDEGLWLGGAMDAERNDATITAVVDCRFSFGAKFHDRKAKTWRSLERNVDTLQYLAYLIHCRRNNDSSDDQQGVLLVHCAMGRNRGPASLAAYFMLYEGLSLTKALAKIRLARPKSKTWDNTFILELKKIAKLAGGTSLSAKRLRSY